MISHHPDKKSSTTNLKFALVSQDHNEKIHLINEARAVLTDPSRRQDWLAQYSSTQSVAVQSKNDTGPHITQHLSLDVFTPQYILHGATHDTGEDGGMETMVEGEPTHFTYPCRCSGAFVITMEQLEEGVEVVGCEGCGEWVRVLYQVVEHDVQQHQNE
ncbi:hypothetical protein L204_103650 [Cryptococcus depauperatus]